MLLLIQYFPSYFKEELLLTFETSNMADKHLAI